MLTRDITSDLPRGLNETDVEYYQRMAVVQSLQSALTHGRLRATCVTCGVTHSPASVPSWAASVPCPACGDRWAATLWIVRLPDTRTRAPRSEPGACTDLRCTTSESTTCRCACLGTQHGIEA